MWNALAYVDIWDRRERKRWAQRYSTEAIMPGPLSQSGCAVLWTPFGVALRTFRLRDVRYMIAISWSTLSLSPHHTAAAFASGAARCWFRTGTGTSSREHQEDVQNRRDVTQSHIGYSTTKLHTFSAIPPYCISSATHFAGKVVDTNSTFSSCWDQVQQGDCLNFEMR